MMGGGGEALAAEPWSRSWSWSSPEAVPPPHWCMAGEEWTVEGVRELCALYGDACVPAPGDLDSVPILRLFSTARTPVPLDGDAKGVDAALLATLSGDGSTLPWPCNAWRPLPRRPIPPLGPPSTSLPSNPNPPLPPPRPPCPRDAVDRWDAALPTRSRSRRPEERSEPADVTSRSRRRRRPGVPVLGGRLRGPPPPPPPWSSDGTGRLGGALVGGPRPPPPDPADVGVIPPRTPPPLALLLRVLRRLLPRRWPPCARSGDARGLLVVVPLLPRRKPSAPAVATCSGDAVTRPLPPTPPTRTVPLVCGTRTGVCMCCTRRLPVLPA